MLLLLCCFVFLWDVKQTNTKNELARDVPERTWIETAQTANERLFERLIWFSAVQNHGSPEPKVCSISPAITSEYREIIML